jgi:hypothetical protein
MGVARLAAPTEPKVRRVYWGWIGLKDLQIVADRSKK